MLVLKCPRHPRYTGEQSPRASCLICIGLWKVRLQAEYNHVTVVVTSRRRVKVEEAHD